VDNAKTNPRGTSVPNSVFTGVVLFGSSLAVGWVLICIGDRSNLTPGLNDTAANTFIMFALSHLLIVPLFTSPVWAVQLFLLLKTYRGRNWARLLLLSSTIIFMYLLLDLKEFRTAFSSSTPDHLLHVLIRVVPATIQLIALVLLFSPASNQWFSPNYRRSH